MAETRCSIIIPVHNQAALTKQCLDSIVVEPPKVPFEVLVVDDASTDSTPGLLSGYRDSVRVVHLEKRSGFATACNTGAASAQSEYILFLNNDTITLPGWLDAMVAYADGKPKVSVVGSKLLYGDGTVQHAGVVFSLVGDPLHVYSGAPADHPAVNKSRRFQVVTGACLLIRRGAFEEARGFDAAYENDLEDVDLCLRLGQLGHEVHYCHESVLYHLESASRGAKGLGRSAPLYRSRWGLRVKHDELDYYLEDGLLDILRAPEDFKGVEQRRELALFQARLWQVLLLLRERVRLKIEGAPDRGTGTPHRLRRMRKAQGAGGPFPQRRSRRTERPLRRQRKVQHPSIRELQAQLASGYPDLHPDHADRTSIPNEGSGRIAEVNGTHAASYGELRSQLREEVLKTVPTGSTVLVVSNGDNQLIEELEGRRCWHFPGDGEEPYPGPYPTDSVEATAQLASLRSRGARYLVFPSTSFWWLEHYREFRQHLEDTYRVAASSDTGLIFDLEGGRDGNGPNERQEVVAGSGG